MRTKKGLVEYLACAFAGQAVELSRFGEQVEEDLDGFTSGVDLGSFGVDQLTAQPFTLVPDLPEPLADLLARPFRIADEVEVTVFLSIELGDLGIDLIV